MQGNPNKHKVCVSVQKAGGLVSCCPNSWTKEKLFSGGSNWKRLLWGEVIW